MEKKKIKLGKEFLFLKWLSMSNVIVTWFFNLSFMYYTSTLHGSYLTLHGSYLCRTSYCPSSIYLTGLCMLNPLFHPNLILENFLNSILIFVYLLSTLTSHCEFSYLTTLFLTYLPNCVVVSFFGFLVPHNESVTARWAIFGFQFNHLTKKLWQCYRIILIRRRNCRRKSKRETHF